MGQDLNPATDDVDIPANEVVDELEEIAEEELAGDVPDHPQENTDRTGCITRVLAVAVVMCVLIAVYALVVRSAIKSGREKGEEWAQATLAAEIEKQVTLAATDLEQGRRELAARRLSFVLTKTPEYPNLAPTMKAAQATNTPTPTATPVPSPTPTPPQDPEQVYSLAEETFGNSEWITSIETLLNLQTSHPEYNPDQVQYLLYHAYINHGMDMLEEDRLEEGLFYLDEASTFWALPEEVVAEQERTIRYMRAMSYWGVDWERVIAEFEILTYGTIAYRDVFVRLIEAHVEYGDDLIAIESWCEAEEQYAEAVRLKYDAAIEEKRLDAARSCQLVTPTPISGLPGGDHPVGPIAGLSVGKIAYTVFNTTNGLYDLMVVDALAPSPVRYYSHVGQPAWRWNGTAVIFKSWAEDGLLTMPADGGSAEYVLDYAASYPTFSPDGSRFAFTTKQYSEEWEIYTMQVDGSGYPQYLAKGNYPVWGPTGYVAFSGCDFSGTKCGIMIDNPDDGESARQLTSSLLDIPHSWSLDGNNIAYMSMYDGDWDVYNVHMSGAVSLLTNSPAVDALPAWAPDGSGLAFLSDRDGRWGIYIMSPDGSSQRKVIDLGEQHHNWTSERLSWGP
ncbi:MAG: hypothetical protein ABFQ89_01260 [Chloroflexota bacterium]